MKSLGVLLGIAAMQAEALAAQPAEIATYPITAREKSKDKMGGGENLKTKSAKPNFSNKKVNYAQHKRDKQKRRNKVKFYKGVK